jgi:hypothetical protein
MIHDRDLVHDPTEKSRGIGREQGSCRSSEERHVN